MGKRGRPVGATSALKKPANLVADRLNLLIELWLSGVTIQSVTQTGAPITLRAPTERRFTVPRETKRALCRLAIAQLKEFDGQARAIQPQLDEMMQRIHRSVEAELRRRGWSNEQINQHFKMLKERARKRRVTDFKVPSVDEVLAVADRRAPSMTLRRHRRPKDDREKAYEEYCRYLTRGEKAGP